MPTSGGGIKTLKKKTPRVLDGNGCPSEAPYGCFLPDLTRFGTYRHPNPSNARGVFFYDNRSARRRRYPSEFSHPPDTTPRGSAREHEGARRGFSAQTRLRLTSRGSIARSSGMGDLNAGITRSIPAPYTGPSSMSRPPTTAITGLPSFRARLATPTGAFPEAVCESIMPSPVTTRSARAARSSKAAASSRADTPDASRAPIEQQRRPEASRRAGAGNARDRAKASPGPADTGAHAGLVEQTSV